MSHVSLFSSPLLLGFDRVERMLDRVAKSANDGYPPYNIEQIGENSLRISLAVAGFTLDQLTVSLEDNQLTVRGKQAEDPNRVYLHRGIAARQFQRSFVIAEGIQISAARLDNGLLHIELQRPKPASVTRNIEITASQPKNGHAHNGTAQQVDATTVEPQ
ncbi:MAG: Hsp20 family protein [Alphaproteobacteria bacterium]|nr:Hsp20 family protein [Alphaproteobacteria bacterium]MDP1671110.1 Hsp20 family protein [Alphaproteobacteria bacterium]